MTYSALPPLAPPQDMRPGQTKEPEDLHLSPGRLEEAYAILGRAVEEGKIMGCAVGISRNGQLLEPRAFGRRSIEGASPVGPETIFLTASLTKPVTSTAAMLLVERGLIRLDDPVCSIVPEFGDGGPEGQDPRPSPPVAHQRAPGPAS